MKNPVIFLTVILILGACAGRQDIPDAQPEGEAWTIFHTTPPSQLFFKNVRSVYYYHERRHGKEADLYRLRKWAMTRKRPILYPVIVNDWMKDEAYLFLEPNDFEGGFSDDFRIALAGDTTGQQWALELRTVENQLAYAEVLLEQLKKEQELVILDAKGTWRPFMSESKDRLHFMITMTDYLRLTERGLHHK